MSEKEEEKKADVVAKREFGISGYSEKLKKVTSGKESFVSFLQRIDEKNISIMKHLLLGGSDRDEYIDVVKVSDVCSVFLLCLKERERALKDYVMKQASEDLPIFIEDIEAIDEFFFGGEK